MDDCCYKGKKEIVVTVVVFLFHYFLVELHHFRFEFSSFQFCRVFCTLCLQISAFEDAWMNVVSWGHSLRTSPGCVPLGREGQWQNSAVLGILSQPQSNVNKPGPLNESIYMKLQNYPKFVSYKIRPPYDKMENEHETTSKQKDFLPGRTLPRARVFGVFWPPFVFVSYGDNIRNLQYLLFSIFVSQIIFWFSVPSGTFRQQKQWKSIHYELWM